MAVKDAEQGLLRLALEPRQRQARVLVGLALQHPALAARARRGRGGAGNRAAAPLRSHSYALESRNRLRLCSVRNGDSRAGAQIKMRGRHSLAAQVTHTHRSRRCVSRLCWSAPRRAERLLARGDRAQERALVLSAVLRSQLQANAASVRLAIGDKQDSLTVQLLCCHSLGEQCSQQNWPQRHGCRTSSALRGAAQHGAEPLASAFLPTLLSWALYGAQAGQQLCASPYAALISPASSNASYALALWPARTVVQASASRHVKESAPGAHFLYPVGRV